MLLVFLFHDGKAVAEAVNLPSASLERVTRSWLTEDGLPQDTVNAIVQTRDGFLWIATNAGLARFDGVRFHKFGLQDGLRSVLITALVEDRQGALWIGTSGGGVSRWESGRFTNFGQEDGFHQGLEVITLAADREGSVWIGTDKGLVRWNDGTFRMIGDAQGLPQKQVRALLQDSQGTLWASVMPEGLYRGTKGQFAKVEKSEPGLGGVYSLFEDRDGAVWVGSDSLWKWSNGAWQHFDTTQGLPQSPIPTLAQSSDGTLWVGVRGQGLYSFRGERFEKVSSDGALSTQTINAVTPDREGSIWAGATSGGLHRLSPRVLHFWGTNAGLAPTTLTSIAEDASGGLWIGSSTRGLQRFEKGAFTPLADPAGPGSSAIIYCTTTTNDGAIWAAGEQCLFRFHPGQPTQAYLDAPVKDEAVRALCADGDAVWLGSYAATLLKCDANGVRVVAPAGSFPGNISSIVRESEDTLWIGTSEGLHRWVHGQVRTWTTKDGLPAAYVRALHRDPDGTIWIGTLGGGLVRMKDGRFAQITTRQGLNDDVISQIVPDDSGALWLGGNRGIMRLERRDVDAVADGSMAELHPVIFGRNEGMLKEQCFGGTSPTAFKSRDGRLFFPAVNGFAEIDPRKIQDLSPLAPKASIEEILVDHQPHVAGTELAIPPGAHRLEIAYTAPLLRGGEWVSFRHKLEGFDHGWSNPGRSRAATYDGLPPGRYVFRVAAADSEGQWSEPNASLAFSVQPYFWQTLWFRAGILLALVAASGAAAWWHLHRKHHRQLALIASERKQQSELAHASRVSLLGELSASLAHELKQPLAAILSNAQAALRFLNHDPADVGEVREILKDIASEDRRASEIIGRLRAMMKKGETQLESRDLSADVHQALQLIHSDLVERNVSVDTNLSLDLPPVLGDHIQVQQVLLNLVVNGCDAMHENSPDERHLVIETALEGSDSVRVSVADRGPGIPAEMLARIFEPFYTTKDTGLGMGLAICRAIIGVHGGHLWATNNPDRGATFHFTLMLGERRLP